METAIQALKQVMAAAEAAPPALFWVAMALLPLGPFPASVLFITAGIRFGVGGGFCAGMAALAVNMSLGYLLARRVVRRPLESLLARRGQKVPVLAREEELPFLLLFRITPGMPLFLQNYVLGLAGIRFSVYLPVSLAVQVPYVLGFVWLGQSLTQTSGWKVLVGVSAMVALGLGVRIVRSRLSRRVSATGSGGVEGRDARSREGAADQPDRGGEA